MHTRATAAAVMFLVLALSAGCSSHRPATDADENIDPLKPSTMDATTVAVTAMQTILSWNPAVDASASDAFKRAAPWLTGHLATVAAEPTTTVRPDPRWADWKAKGSSISATCAPPPAASATDGLIDLVCTQHVLTPSAPVSNLPAELWRATVTHTSDGWRLSAYQYLRQA